MPYFKNDKVNILFIHIPKACGTSLTNYFLDKHNIYRDINIHPYAMIAYIKTFEGIHYHHLEYSVIKSNKDFFLIDFNNLNVITCVRNPYDRLVSDLFWLSLISKETNPEKVFLVIRDNFLLESNLKKYDNHPLPQYKYLLDTDGSFLKNVTILHTESIQKDLNAIGYHDFCKVDNASQSDKINYLSYLNRQSLDLINSFYAKDFEYFNYNTM
jgi:hypothetical protein